MEIPEAEQARILAALGFALAATPARAASRAADWRPDVQGEADLVEEIARVASLEQARGHAAGRARAGVARPILTPMQRREGQARRRIAALGFNECVTYSFIDRAAAELFGGGGEAVRLENPISSEMSHLRPDLLPGLLRAAARNQARGFADLALFEIGQAFPGGEPGEQVLLASGLRAGATAPRNPHGTRRPVDLWDARADAEAALAAIGAPAALMIQRARAAPGSTPAAPACSRSGRRRVLAAFGELHPRVLQALDVRGPAVAFTPRPRGAALPQGAQQPPARRSSSPTCRRSSATSPSCSTRGVEAEAVLRAARAADKALIDEVSVFDVFAGPKAEAQMGPGKKSLAIAVRLQPTERTLTEAEIEAVSARVVASVAKATGGTLRALTGPIRRRGPAGLPPAASASPIREVALGGSAS